MAAGDRASMLHDLALSARADRGHLTRTTTSLNKAIAALLSSPTVYNGDQVLFYQNKQQLSFQNLDKKYRECMVLEDGSEEDIEEWERKLLAISTELDLSADAISAAFKKVKVHPAGASLHPPAATGTTAAATTVPKANDTLKPDILSLDNSPLEFRQWKRKFRAFYDGSFLKNSTLAEQQSYVLNFVDADLNGHLLGHVAIDTEVWTDDGLVAILTDLFNARYPLFSRRMDFFRFQRTKGQAVSSFIAKLVQLGTEADLNSLTTDDVLSFRVLSGMNDDTLFEKIDEMSPPPDFKGIMKRVSTYEGTQAAKKSIHQLPTSSTAAKVAQTKGGKPKNQQSQKTRAMITPESLRGRCGRCGHGRHTTRDCPRNDLTCYTCGKPNHTSLVCLQEYNASRSRQRTPSPRRETRGFQPAASSSAATPPRDSRARSVQQTSPPSQPSSSRTVSPDYYEFDQDDADHSSIRSVRSDVRVLRPLSTGRPTPTLDLAFSVPNGPTFSYPVLPDTGATRTVMAYNVARQVGISIDTSRKERLYAANGVLMDCSGFVILEASIHGNTVPIDVLISTDISNEILLSWHDLIALGVVPAGFPLVNCARAVSSTPPPPPPSPTTPSTHQAEDSITSLQMEFSGTLSNSLEGKTMRGKPMRIHLVPGDIVPKQVYTVKKIPVHQSQEVADLIADLVKNKIITRLATDEPSDWISRADFVPKENGKAGLRLVTDYKALNKYVQRPVHPFPSAGDIIQGLQPDSKIFCKLDAVQGYFQIPLEESSSYLTTFLLADGRYRYLRAPMGLSSSSDEWNARSDVVIEGLPFAQKIVDDILIEAPDSPTLYRRIRQVLRRCEKFGITISLRKLQIGSRVKFAGYVISEKGVYPDPEKIAALTEFPAPTDITTLRSFLGLANQLGHFVPDLSHLTKRLRLLLKKNQAWTWLPAHDQDFRRVKDILTRECTVKPFDPSLPTSLLTDASRNFGLGYMLLQKDRDGKPRVIQCGSCSLTPAQKNYAVIELECLAIVWAIKKCNFYLRGIRTFSVITDHRPLVGIFKKSVHDLDNQRLVRFVTRVSDYVFDVEWTPGKEHLIADALSRAPVFSPFTYLEKSTVNSAF